VAVWLTPDVFARQVRLLKLHEKAAGRRELASFADRRPQVVRRAVAAFGGLAAALLVGGVPGLLAAPVVFALLDRFLGRLEPRSVRERRQRLHRDLPVAADLFAACLLAGRSPADAAEAVADAVGGPLADELRPATAALRLGGDPVAVWTRLAAEPALAPFGRALARSSATGAALSDAAVRLADTQRAARHRSQTAAARRVPVLATLPLGLCFLPAFLLIGVFPVVAGLGAVLFTTSGGNP
jgi:Flp pilus assembly protein TadB